MTWYLEKLGMRKLEVAEKYVKIVKNLYEDSIATV